MTSLAALGDSVSQARVKVSSSFNFGDGVTAERFGRMVAVTVNGGWNVDVGTWSSKFVGTLPEGMRPASGFYVPAVMDIGICLIQVSAGGSLVVVSRNVEIGSGGIICAQLCFLAKD